jgi:hypothetical protein
MKSSLRGRRIKRGHPHDPGNPKDATKGREEL